MTALPTIVTPAPRGAWSEVAAADPGVVVTQTPQWRDALVTFAHYRDASRLYDFGPGGRLVVPLVRHGRRTGRYAGYPPAWGMGGVIADRGVTPAQLRYVLDDLAASPALQILIRPNPLRADLWRSAAPPGAVAIDRTAHVLDLAGGYEAVWSRRFRSDTRRKVRIAERAGVEVVTGRGDDLISEFFELYRLSVERWARSQHEPIALARVRARHRDSEAKWRAVAACVGPALRVSIAHYEGRPVAGIFVLQGANAHYTRGAMDSGPAGTTQANFLLHARAIEAACDAGCRWYHMGETGASEGLARFKTRFGAEAYPHWEYRLERLPLTKASSLARTAVKRAIGFRDA